MPHRFASQLPARGGGDRGNLGGDRGNLGGGNRPSTLPAGGDRGNLGGGRGDGNWQYNPQHRGGTPYRDRATADRFGGTTRGDSLSNRQANARKQLSRQGGNLASNRAGGGGLGNRAGGGIGAGTIQQRNSMWTLWWKFSVPMATTSFLPVNFRKTGSEPLTLRQRPAKRKPFPWIQRRGIAHFFS